MRAYQLINLLLTVACCLAGQSGWAQRSAVAPLAPAAPVVRRALPSGIALPDGMQAGRQPPRQPSATTAMVPAGRRVWPDPVYLLNSHLILNGLTDIKPQDIAAIQVYKGADAPAQWRSLTENGIIDITLKAGSKPKLKTKSLAAIRRQAKVTGLVSFRLNSMRLEDSSLRIASAAIARVEVWRDEYETVLNICLVPHKSIPRHDLPGTIYIRGVASR